MISSVTYFTKQMNLIAYRL